MDVTAGWRHERAGLIRKPDADTPPVGRMANAIRTLTLDAVEHAGSGDVDYAMGMADVATALWTRFQKYDAADPRWPDRDRCVLSAGRGAMLLYALIHLTGHAGMTAEDLRHFRQLHSPAAGSPALGDHPAIETTSGAPGQGLGAAVGMAIAERNMAARFGRSLVDHRTWVLASTDDMMQGVSHEAASLAGQLGLARLTVLLEQRAEAGPDDVLKRFAAYGWAAKRVDAQDAGQINAALSFAVRSRKPTLIVCSVQGPAAADRRAPPFAIQDDPRQRWLAAGLRGATARRSWLKRLARHSQRVEFERVIAGRLPDTWHEAVIGLKQELASARPRQSSRRSSQICLEAMLAATPELAGGIAGSAGVATNHGGREIHFGARVSGMTAAANGMALHRGIVPYIGSRLVQGDDLRPALRIGAMMGQRVIGVLTHDSIGVGEDGPAHQPVEHLAALRATPNLHVFRPADAMETAECWELAVRRGDGPSVLVLSRQPLPALRTDWFDNRCARGGYVLAEADGPRQATVIATGSEVSIAMAGRERLAAEGIAVAVVSLPCWALFAAQDEAYKAQVLGGAPRVGIEAAGRFGWDPWLGPDGAFIGMTGFGASGPSDVLYGHFGITAEAVVAAVVRQLG